MIEICVKDKEAAQWVQSHYPELLIQPSYRRPGHGELYHIDDTIAFRSDDHLGRFDFRCDLLRNVDGRTEEDDLLLKAIGRSKHLKQSILDVTGGFLGDASVLAASGHQVHACERHPVIYLLAANGLARAQHHLPNLSLELIDGLTKSKAYACDIIYFDPMFEQDLSGALPSKKAQVLRALIAGVEEREDTGIEAQLAELLQRAAARKVILKRPIRGPTYGRPTGSVQGTTIRYDIYHR